MTFSVKSLVIFLALVSAALMMSGCDDATQEKKTPEASQEKKTQKADEAPAKKTAEAAENVADKAASQEMAANKAASAQRDADKANRKEADSRKRAADKAVAQQKAAAAQETAASAKSSEEPAAIQKAAQEAATQKDATPTEMSDAGDDSCEMNAGRWFTEKMTKEAIVSKASVHCMKANNLAQPSVYCPSYVKTIEEQFKRAKATKDTMYSLREFCDIIDKHAEPEDHVVIDHHSAGEL